jgi:hypothetical protein
MSIAEKYARSTQSSNLKDDEQHHNTDSLAAMALSKRLGSELFRVKYANDSTSYNRLLIEWRVIVANKAGHRKWPDHISPNFVAKEALDYWINPICLICEGRGFHQRINSAGAFEYDCLPCGNTGKRPTPGNSRNKRFIEDMVETLNDMERVAGGLAIKRLADAFEI